MSMNILNDISAVYLQQVAEKKDDSYLETDMKKRHENNEKSREEMKRTKANKDMVKAARKSMGVEDDEDDEDDLNEASYSAKAARAGKDIGKPGKQFAKIAKSAAKRYGSEERGKKVAGAILAKLRKESLDPVGKEDSDIDNDGDSDKSDKYLLNRRKSIGKAIKKEKMKESFSNWRQDLAEVMDDVESEKEIKEKKVNNKVKINPEMKESFQDLGGFLIEMVEIDEVDYIVESVYDELLDEGYEEDDIEDAIEYALTEATVTYGHDTGKSNQKKTGAGHLIKAVGRLARQKLSSKVGGAKRVAKQAVSSGARKVAKGALGVARKMESGSKKTSTVERKPSTYRGAGAGTKEKVSSGSYTPPVKKKSEKPDDPWKGSSTVPQKPKPKPKAEKPSDPWEGSATTPSKAKPKVKTKTTKVSGGTQKTSTRKKKSKLDDLLASVRNEEVQLDEKALSKQQQKFMGMVYAVKKGEMKAPSPEVAKAAAGMSEKSARDYAKTKHKGLPQRKNVEEQMDEPMDSVQDKSGEMQKKKIQVQKVRDLTTRLQAARKGVY